MKYKQLLRNYKLYLVCGLLLVDGWFFSTVNPTTAPSSALITGYILAVATTYLFIRGGIGALVRLLGHGEGKGRQLAKISTAFVALLLALQSVGQLSTRDFVALIPLVVVGYLYISYSRRIEKRN